MAIGDILLAGDTTNRIYRWDGEAWDSGLTLPTGETAPTGLTVDPTTGDILVVGFGTRRIHRWDGEAWDSGFAVPSGEGSPRGLAVDPATGDILIVGSITDRIYRWNGEAWDSGFAIPSNEIAPIGLAVDPATGDILLAGTTTDRVYRWDGEAWDSGFAVPSNEISPQGLAVDPTTGDILIAGAGTRRVYRWDGEAWDSGFAIPSGEFAPLGLAVDYRTTLPATTLVAGSATLAGTLTIPLTLADFTDPSPDQEVVALGLIQAERDGDTVYRVGTNTGVLLDGELGLDGAVATISRIDIQQNGAVLFLVRSPGPVDGGEPWNSFATGDGPYAAATVWVQTDDVLARIDIADATITAGVGFISLTVPEAAREALNRLTTNSRFLIAVSRPVPDLPAVTLSAGVATLSGAPQEEPSDILIVGTITRRIYRWNGSAWDSGFAIPSGETTPLGLTVDPTTGDILVVGFSTRRIHRWNGEAWDSGLALPPNETAPEGLAVDPATGDILLVGDITDRIYRWDGEAWDSGFAIPSGEGFPNGLTIDPTTGDILIVGFDTARIYRWNGEAWDSGFAIPSNEYGPTGLAVDYRITPAAALPAVTLRTGVATLTGTPQEPLALPAVTLRAGVATLTGTPQEPSALPATTLRTGVATLSGAPQEEPSDILLAGRTTNRVYRWDGEAWDSGFDIPPNEINPRGLAVDPTTGDILITGTATDRIYRWNGEAWDSGFAIPSGESSPRGLAIDPTTGDILIAGSVTDHIYRWDGEAWDSGFAIPSGEGTPNGLTIDPTTGDILITGRDNDRIYRWDGEAWDSGFAIPSGEGDAAGLTIDPATGDILIAGRNTARIYRWNGEAWDSGFAIPPNEFSPHGLAVDYRITPAAALPAVTLRTGVATLTGAPQEPSALPATTLRTGVATLSGAPQLVPALPATTLRTGVATLSGAPQLVPALPATTLRTGVATLTGVPQEPSALPMVVLKAGVATLSGDSQLPGTLPAATLRTGAARLLLGDSVSPYLPATTLSSSPALLTSLIDIFRPPRAYGDLLLVTPAAVGFDSLIGFYQSIYRYHNGVWFQETRLPNLHRTADAWDVLVDPNNGDFLVFNGINNHINRWDGTTWEDGIPFPPGEPSFPISETLVGISLHSPYFDPHTGRLTVYGSATRMVYSWTGTEWVTRDNNPLTVVDGEEKLSEVVFDPFRGDLITFGQRTHRIYRWDGTKWDKGIAVHALLLAAEVREQIDQDIVDRLSNALFVDPATGHILFIGIALGLYDGMRWHRLGVPTNVPLELETASSVENLDSLSFHATFDPITSDVIFTGQYDIGDGGGHRLGIWRRGLSDRAWTQLPATGILSLPLTRGIRHPRIGYDPSSPIEPNNFVSLVDIYLNAQPIPGLGNILLVGDGGGVYRWDGSAWVSSFEVPPDELDLSPQSFESTGLAVDPTTGDILVVGLATDRIYRWDGEAWDSGFAVPSNETIPLGLAVDPATGDILIAGAATDRIYRWDGEAWDSGFAIPSGEGSPRGLAVDPANGDILIVGGNTRRIYRWNEIAWDSGFAIPSGEFAPRGLTVDPTNGDILVVGTATDRIYRWDGEAWDSGFAIPAGERAPSGLAVDHRTLPPPVVLRISDQEHPNYPLYTEYLQQPVEVIDQLPDLYYQIQEEQTARITVIDTFRQILADNNVQDLRGLRMRVRIVQPGRYLPLMEHSGTVASVDENISSMTIISDQRDQDALQTNIPKPDLFDLFPDLEIDNTEGDEESTLSPILPFGVLRKAQLFPLAKNFADGSFDYGAFFSGGAASHIRILNVYRSPGAIVPPAEYSLQTTTIKGDEYAFIRFTLDQADASGQPHTIWADLDNDFFDHNLIRVVEFLLGNETFGLGLKVHALAFTRAANLFAESLQLSAEGGLYGNKVPAQDVIQHLLAQRGQLTKNAAGEYQVDVDHADLHVAASIPLGGGGETIDNLNINSIRRFSPPREEQVKKLTVFGSFDPGFGDGDSKAVWLSKAVYDNLQTIGREEEIHNPYIGGRSVDRHAQYLADRLKVLDHVLEAVGTFEVHNVQLSQLVRVTIPFLRITDQELEIRGLSFSGQAGDGQVQYGFPLRLTNYNADAYTYVQGTNLTEKTRTAVTDYSRTFPAAPTEITVTRTDGSSSTTFTVSALVPAVNATHLAVSVFRAGGDGDDEIDLTSAVQVEREETKKAASGKTTVTVIVNGESGSFDVAVFARNADNETAYQDGFVVSFINQ